ncbi:MAG TPA: vitamin B12 dependent-methionine synthase activation domain-containing protein [Terriglobales bacterium]|nr:vitamin B12 dependent-methionine synthase activation domain-containing protein [Terriglobales bacterium]
MFRTVRNFKITFDQKEILRLLGHTSKNKGLKDGTRKLVSEMIELSSALVKPSGVYAIKEAKELPAECLFESAEKAAFCICTIGNSLEKEVGALSRKGELTKAFILDAIGSVAAESVAEYLNHVIAAEAKKKKLHCSTRFSPGYGGWKLEAQRFIFDLLPSEKIGVRLNRSFMMIPRKSVSFVVNLSRNRFKDKNSDPCKVCGLKECRFRKGQT